MGKNIRELALTTYYPYGKNKERIKVERTQAVDKALAEYEAQIRADAIADCVLENGEYCWQECCSTEHCKECKWLGNGDTIWFEQIQKGGRE